MPIINGLDQKIAARGTSILLNIRGEQFAAGAAVEFLDSTGAVDPQMAVTGVNVVSADEIQAELSVDPYAALGPRRVRVTSGGASGTSAGPLLDVIALNLRVSLGAKTGPRNVRIANHPTVVRAGIEGTLQTSGTSLVRGRLYVFDGERQITGSPFEPNKPKKRGGNEDSLEPGSPSEEARCFMRDTLNFYFGMRGDLPTHSALEAGRYSFLLAVSPTAPQLNPAGDANITKSALKAQRDVIVVDSLPEQNFVKTRPLRLIVVIDPRLDKDAADALLNRHLRDLEYVAAAFPLDGSKTNYVWKPVRAKRLDLNALKPEPLEDIEPPAWHVAILDKLTSNLASANEKLLKRGAIPYDKITLFLDPATSTEIMAGAAGWGGRPGVASMRAGGSESVLSHELGHNFGLEDEYKRAGLDPKAPNPRRIGAATAPPNADNNANFVEEGTERLWPLSTSGSTYLAATAAVDVAGETLPDVPYRIQTFMGNDFPNKWTDFAERKHLYDQLRLPASAAGTVRKAATGEVVYVQGFISMSDQVTVTRLARGDAVPIATEPGDFVFELLDSAGNAVSASSFGVNFQLPHGGPGRHALFSVTAPFVGGAVMVRIRKGSEVLYSHPISASAPEVQILSPAGGEAISGPFTIAWGGSDPDGDALTYSIVYLPDDETAVPIADGLTGTAFQWEEPSLEGGTFSGRIVVTANDGVHETSATSGPISVAKRGPSVTILEPRDGMAVPAGTQVTLSGAGSDAEDGLLPPESLRFRSSIDGDLETGAAIAPTLSQGVHTISLRGVDSDGLAAEASITIVVGPASAVPVLGTVSPAAAHAGSAVTLSGRNFTSGATVKFGNTAASVVSVNASQIVVTVPSGLPLGETEISVASGGFNTNAVRFHVIYGRPLVRRITPDSGPPGTPVYLSGAEFAASPTGNTVKFGNTTAIVLDAGLDGLLIAVPAGLNPGGTNVTVTTAQGVSDPLPFTVTSGEPASRVVLHSSNPSSGSAGTLVTISGRGFSSVQSRNAVNFGGFAATPVNATPDTLQVIVPFGLAAGAVNIVVSVDSYPSNPLTFTVSTGTPNPTPTPCATILGQIAFASSRDGNNEIYLMNPDGSGQVRLTNNPASDHTPAWSPDGTKIAFSSDRDGNQEIYVMNPDGSGQTRLTNNLAADYFPAWSPDGARIAFTRQMTAANLEIFLMNVNGTGEVNITNNPANDQQPAWSPDGTKLVFGSNRDDTHLELYTMNANGSGVTRLTNNLGGVDYYPAWSPDGTKIAFTTDRVSNPHSYDFALEVFVMNADGTGQTNLTNNGRGDLNPAWAPDGSKIVFISDRNTAQYVPQLYSMNSNGTDVIRLTNNAASDASPAWSATQCNPTPAAVREVQNISTRVVVGTGENVAIGGFIILGNGSKRVIVRAIGPSLANFGVAGALEDPTLELFNGTGSVIAFNDDWPGSSQNQEIAAILPPSDSVEAAIIAALTPGNYTAVLRGYENGTGIALVEVYDLDQGAPSRLANISTRGQVGTGGSVLIGGFIVGKQAQFIIRAIGPSLGALGIGNALANPILELYNAQGTKFDTNDNWQDNPSAGQVSGIGLAPNNALESAVIHTLPAGNYTAIVRGFNDGVGVGLVEVYSLQ